MANTYSQVYIQYVFAVKRRDTLLQKPWRDDVFKYITGIIQAKEQKSIIVNGVADHVHVFVGLKPQMSMADLVRDIKAGSSKFINEQGFLRQKFAWQDGYGVFSYAHPQIDAVYKYIENQEAHHAKHSFRDEYLLLLKEFGIAYDEKYIFHEPI